MNLEGLASSFTWEYDETSGFLNRFTYPNGMVRNNTYHSKLNLLAFIGYELSENGETVVGHEYQYDALMRPTQSRDSWDAVTAATVREFAYNYRSELTGDQIRQRCGFNYQYDDIGNRETTRELGEGISYTTHRHNQYTDVARIRNHCRPPVARAAIRPESKLRQAFGKSAIDANDRPVNFTSQNDRTVIECSYDYLGRRFEKKVTVNGSTASYSWYLYRGYLQIAELDLMHPEPVLV